MHPDRVNRSVRTYGSTVLQDISYAGRPCLKIRYACLLLWPPICIALLNLSITKHGLGLNYVYIYNFSTLSEKWSLQALSARRTTPPFPSEFVVGSLFRILFESRCLIWHIFAYSIWLIFPDLNHHFWFDFGFVIQFYSTFMTKFDPILRFDATFGTSY